MASQASVIFLCRERRLWRSVNCRQRNHALRKASGRATLRLSASGTPQRASPIRSFTTFGDARSTLSPCSTLPFLQPRRSRLGNGAGRRDISPFQGLRSCRCGHGKPLEGAQRCINATAVPGANAWAREKRGANHSRSPVPAALAVFYASCISPREGTRRERLTPGRILSKIRVSAARDGPRPRPRGR
jgi:hypothetical protein